MVDYDIPNLFPTFEKFLAVAISKMAPKIQHFPISSKFDMWVPIFYAVFLAAILKMADISEIAPLVVTYHYVKFYVSIIIHVEVININVRNFNFSKWPPQYRKNSTFFDFKGSF
jgi:uncharacterized membrane protein (GlpM family)